MIRAKALQGSFHCLHDVPAGTAGIEVRPVGPTDIHAEFGGQDNVLAVLAQCLAQALLG
ncbi:hypothetical protein D3C74_491970 [compost metagenome]